MFSDFDEILVEDLPVWVGGASLLAGGSFFVSLIPYIQLSKNAILSTNDFYFFRSGVRVGSGRDGYAIDLSGGVFLDLAFPDDEDAVADGF